MANATIQTTVKRGVDQGEVRKRKGVGDGGGLWDEMGMRTVVKDTRKRGSTRPGKTKLMVAKRKKTGKGCLTEQEKRTWKTRKKEYSPPRGSVRRNFKRVKRKRL